MSSNSNWERIESAVGFAVLQATAQAFNSFPVASYDVIALRDVNIDLLSILSQLHPPNDSLFASRTVLKLSILSQLHPIQSFGEGIIGLV
ncbi:MAG: hypothetical protein NZ954_08705 [Thermofilaceae archaeon]|nr:hypothetical protein [Thermofilaceae archaeon]